MRTLCAFALTALLLPPLLRSTPAGADDTDPLNPALREMPRSGPIVGGKRQQPTQAEIQERALERQMARPGGAPLAEPSPRDRENRSQELYQRVLRNSDRPTPRSIDPSQ